LTFIVQFKILRLFFSFLKDLQSDEFWISVSKLKQEVDAEIVKEAAEEKIKENKIEL
jgi:hypothetical protein